MKVDTWRISKRSDKVYEANPKLGISREAADCPTYGTVTRAIVSHVPEHER
jgi:hypothetical protein